MDLPEYPDDSSGPESFHVEEELKAYSYDLGERCMSYALEMIELYRELDKSERAAQKLSDQLLRSASSIGANLEESRAAQSRRDFAHKHALALKEARESLYWLRLFQRAHFLPAPAFDPLIVESRELIAILTTIVAKTRS